MWPVTDPDDLDGDELEDDEDDDGYAETPLGLTTRAIEVLGSTIRIISYDPSSGPDTGPITLTATEAQHLRITLGFQWTVLRELQSLLAEGEA
jgi:hypothetical protein